MEFLSALWLPVILSAVLVFVVSSIIHMALKYHESDYAKLPGEDAILAAMREQGVGPGLYAFPRCVSMKEMGAPEMVARYESGPVGTATVGPNGPPALAKALVYWFLYALAVGVLVAYLGYHALGPGAPYLTVFRVAGTAAILAHVVGVLPDGIWRGTPRSVVLKNVCDGLIYGLVTAGAFAWLWPVV